MFLCLFSFKVWWIYYNLYWIWSFWVSFPRFLVYPFNINYRKIFLNHGFSICSYPLLVCFSKVSFYIHTCFLCLYSIFVTFFQNVFSISNASREICIFSVTVRFALEPLLPQDADCVRYLRTFPLPCP